MRMGRRSRARERAATPAEPVAGSAPPGRRRARTGLLNPFSFKPPSRSRVRNASVGFALSAAVFAIVGWLSGQPAWFNSAVLLAILALVWGARAAFMGRDDRST
jgi:hypothetical protein